MEKQIVSRDKMFEQYIANILKIVRQGDAREESYYSELKTLLEEFANSISRKNIIVTIQPRKVESNNPDFRVWNERQNIIGYIEAKTPETNLENIEKTEQVRRYLLRWENVMLTDFFEFRLYKKGMLHKKARIADSIAIRRFKGVPCIEDATGLEDLLNKFFIHEFPSIVSAETLSVELAKRTRYLRDEVIAQELKEEKGVEPRNILGFYEAFQKYLIKGLTKEKFADLYSQTITYGLFASRINCKDKFSRQIAFDNIPHTIGILRDMFRYISLEDLPYSIELVVDEISDVLDRIDQKILHEGKDPILYFYETFLAKYDPKERKKKGVYYTPESVVSYIVRSIDLLLEEKFGLTDGLASKEVTILDPAGGTLTFLSEAIRRAVERHSLKYGEGTKREFIKEHILGDFYAFELMIAPYVIGHLRMSFQLRELGYELQKDERVKFYLTDTLEKEDIEQTFIHGISSLAEESRKAGEVKKKIPILVILGNPPYHGISENMGPSACELIEPYKLVDGKDFHERKHWLHDDYVKFIRFGEEKIAQTGKGVVGYITNHRYLENPTFRGMRQHLMRNFDEIHVLDLHGAGSSDRKPPSNVKKDENVFNITKGVAISFFVRKENRNDKCRVYHSEIWGTKEQKYTWLLSHDKKTTKWEEIHPHSPFYMFVPMKEKLEEIYHRFWKLTDIFPVNSVGIVTARDRFATDFDKNELTSRIKIFRDTSIPDETLRREPFNLKDTDTFSLRKSREALSQDKNWDRYFTQMLYRPFDVRHVYYTNVLLERPLYETMRHMMRENLALISARSNISSEMNHFFCTQYMTETKCGESTTQSYLFPLYLYIEKGRSANLNPRLVVLLDETYGKSITPEEIFQYIYGVVYSNTYRDRYASLLRNDFPRVPITSNCVLFAKMGGLGKKLLNLHLLKSEELNNPIARFQGEGNNEVERLTYNEVQHGVCINKTQYFEGITEEIWNYQIGGYQVLNKWLKYRKERKLSLEEIKHFCKVATAIKRTIEIQKELDSMYGEIEKDIIEFKKNGQNTDLRSYTQ